MKYFAKLIENLDSTNKTNDKISFICEYLSTAGDRDKAWMIFFLSGNRLKKPFTSAQLRQWAVEESATPQWLFEESYAFVGDLAETISLLLCNEQSKFTYSLSELAGIITSKGRSEEEIRKEVAEVWKNLDRREIFVFNKMMTGGFRLGVSGKILINAIAKFEDKDPDEIAYRLSGKWHPENISYNELIHADNLRSAVSRPYPFCLAYPLESVPEELGNEEDWCAEWKWDGIRAQIIRRKGETFIWSRGGELITEKFPELLESAMLMPEGTVIDGEILSWRNGRPLEFSVLQKRIGRKKITKSVLEEAPVCFMAYDLLECEGKDIRQSGFIQRRGLLEEILKKMNSHQKFMMSPFVSFYGWGELAERRKTSLEKGAEGLMIKRKHSPYNTGRKKGDWWKWKTDPMTADAVMIYAQAGHGRRSGLFTDYTFGVWDKGKLVTIAKAYSGLTNEEIEEVDRFVKSNTLERFGPVRTVTPELVFEIAFEGIARSPRHKSGIALRFPRISRWRRDKKPKDADTLDMLKQLLDMRS